jgi:hypothetical protein
MSYSALAKISTFDELSNAVRAHLTAIRNKINKPRNPVFNQFLEHCVESAQLLLAQGVVPTRSKCSLFRFQMQKARNMAKICTWSKEPHQFFDDLMEFFKMCFAPQYQSATEFPFFRVNKLL